MWLTLSFLPLPSFTPHPPAPPPQGRGSFPALPPFARGILPKEPWRLHSWNGCVLEEQTQMFPSAFQG